MNDRKPVAASKRGAVVPILLIALGIGWLMTVHQVIPGVNWVWVLGLALAGLLMFVLGGVNKFTVVVGPFLMIATVFSLLRQTGRISIDTEVPSMVIVAGLLWMASYFLPVPPPRWIDLKPDDDRSR